MNVLVYGGNGWIGNQFITLLKNKKIKFHKGQARVYYKRDIVQELNQIKPTHVISFIGRTHGTRNGVTYNTIDYLEEKGTLKENLNDNLYGPLLLSDLCLKKKIHFTYLGTGCIFNYDIDHLQGEESDGFTEEDEPNFFGSNYSIVKGFTDKLMKFYEETTLNLRIRMPISDQPHPRNFITKITNYEKICSVTNSMTVLPELLPIVIDMMIQKKTGTLNLTNPGTISHNEILDLYKLYVDPTFTYQNFSIEEQSKFILSERSNNCLNTFLLEVFCPGVKPIREAVINCLKTYAQAEHDSQTSGETVN